MTTDFESAVWDALKRVKFPGMSRDIVSFGFVHQVKASAGSVVVDLQMATHNPAAGEKVQGRGGADAPRPPRRPGRAGQHERDQAAHPRGVGPEGDRPGRAR